MSTKRDPDWYDEVAAERALRGRPVGRRLTRAERRAVAAELLERGQSTTAISRVLRCSGRTARELSEAA